MSTAQQPAIIIVVGGEDAVRGDLVAAVAILAVLVVALGVAIFALARSNSQHYASSNELLKSGDSDDDGDDEEEEEEEGEEGEGEGEGDDDDEEALAGPAASAPAARAAVNGASRGKRRAGGGASDAFGDD